MDALKDSAAFQFLNLTVNTLFHPEARRWKQEGGKIVGYFYSFIPEEIISAAGLLPFRIRAAGSDGTEFSDARLTQINCSFVRHCLDMALRGELGFLDGVVVFRQCDQVCRMVENWVAKTPPPFFHFVNVPKKSGEEQVELYRRELLKLKRKLEEHFAVVITDEKLFEAIRLHNETRRLQRRLYELRKQKKPPLTGAETHAVVLAGTAMPKELYNRYLRVLLEEIGDKEGMSTPTARLMLIGKEHDDPELLKVIESQGGLVVTDGFSFGSGAIRSDVDDSGDPWIALARHCLENRPESPRLFGTGPLRYAWIKKLVEDFSVDGVIFVRHPFCDMWGFEQGSVMGFLKEEKVPCLVLETEYVLSGVGQIKTRVQAFLEVIGGARA